MLGGTKLFLECFHPVLMFGPVDLQDGANNGDWVNLRDTDGVVFIFIGGVGTAGEDIRLTLQAATDNNGTGAAKVELPNDRRRIFKKQAVSLAAVKSWTLADGDVDETAGAGTLGTYVNTAGAEQTQFVVIDLHIEDIPEDKTHVRLNGSDVGTNEQLGVCIAIVKQRWHRKPENAVSVID